MKFLNREGPETELVIYQQTLSFHILSHKLVDVIDKLVSVFRHFCSLFVSLTRGG